MQLCNSYIFLKNDVGFKKNDKGNYVIVVGYTVPELFSDLFNVKKEKSFSKKQNKNGKSPEELKDLFYKVDEGSFTLSLNNSSAYIISYKFISVNTSYYLDISLDVKRKEEGIAVLELFNNTLIDNKNNINKDYIIIKSFDSISEHYCNKIYPKLNKFERKLRKLLYLIYTGQFDKDYFKKTTSEDLQSSIKGKIKSKHKDKKKKELDYAQVFFESFDFGEIQKLLFEPRWTEIDDNYVKDYLNENKNLTILSDLELRNFIMNVKPKSDWERFFDNKDFSKDIMETIKEIGLLRNNIAHSKLFTRENFCRMNSLLKETEKEIDHAIMITETEDFIKINQDKIQKGLRNFVNNMKGIVASITDSIKPIIEKQQESLNELTYNLNETANFLCEQLNNQDK